jgi:16S rRNA (guanine(966)-N(2))-methyltransferase RsmD
MPGTDIRPTADRLRETIFNVLTAATPSRLQDSTWADLYAGTGAVGIEALSRGAAKVYFVESSAAASRLIRENIQSLQIERGFQLIHGEALRALRQMEAERVQLDFVFLDPPYNREQDYRETLNFLGESNLLGMGAVVIAEHLKKFDPGEVFGKLKRYRKLVQSDAALSFYKRS